MDTISATYTLLALNVFVSGYVFLADPAVLERLVFEVGAVRDKKQTYRVVSSSFVHGNGPHLLLNMMTLFFFGPTVEKTLGTLGFLVVYFGSIASSGIVSVLANKTNPRYRSVGASDAISGVLLSYCVFYPMNEIYLFGLPFGIPAILYGLGFIIISLRLMNAENRVIAHEGHLGGAIAGVVLTLMMRPDALTRLFG